MTSSACATRIEKALLTLPGVLEASVNLALERADVRVVAGQVDGSELESAVVKAGYSARFAEDATGDEDEQHRQREAAALRKELTALAISAALTAPLVAQMIAMVAGLGFHLPPWAELALATPVQFIIGARFYIAAWKALRARSGNMDVLVAMGTTTAYLYSVYLMFALGDKATGELYFEASAVIITLVLLGKYMESRAKRGTTAAIRQLMDLRPKTARVLRNDEEIEIPVEKQVVNDIALDRDDEGQPGQQQAASAGHRFTGQARHAKAGKAQGQGGGKQQQRQCAQRKGDVVRVVDGNEQGRRKDRDEPE